MISGCVDALQYCRGWRINCDMAASISCDMAASFPIQTVEFAVPLQGTTTSFVLSAFSDRIMVVATQLGSLGSIQLARYRQEPAKLQVTHPVMASS